MFIKYLLNCVTSIIIGLLITFSFVSFLLIGSRDVYGETTAIENLQQIKEAQVKYMINHGEYGDFNQLVNSGLLEKRFENHTESDRYLYIMNATPKSDKKPAFYSVNANPKHKGNYILIPTWRYFYVDSENKVIKVNNNQPATASDESLEEEN